METDGSVTFSIEISTGKVKTVTARWLFRLQLKAQ